MIPIPYLREVTIGLAIILASALGVQSCRLASTQKSLKIEKLKNARMAEQVERSGQQLLTCLDQMDSLNDHTLEVAKLGERARAAQEEADRNSARVAAAEAALEAERRRNLELVERAKGLTLCETYEAVIRAIGGDDEEEL